MQAGADLGQLLWGDWPVVRGGVAVLWAAAVGGAVALPGPLWARWRDVRRLRHALSAVWAETAGHTARRRDEMTRAFRESTLCLEWDEFVRRWKEARDGLSDLGGEPRAGVRLRDVLAERPLWPVGPRRLWFAAWPAALAGLGALAALLAAGATGEAVSALPAALWGGVLAIGAEIVRRGIAGSLDHEVVLLDRLAESAFPALSAPELDARSAAAQVGRLERLREDLARSNEQLTGTLDAGLRRIETSTARAASLVSEEQRGALRNVVEELRSSVRGAVESHLGALRAALERAVEHQDAVSGGIARNYERMLEHAEASDRVAERLDRAAGAVDGATRSISETVGGLGPVLAQLREAGSALESTAGRIDHTQDLAAETVRTIRDALDHAGVAVGEQRALVEAGVVELRTVVERLSDGLGAQLESALRNVDASLADAVSRLRRTVDETNTTVDRLAAPVRSAEGATRDMHAALERVRVDVGQMSQWLVQAVEPVRHTLSRIDEKSGAVARALDAFAERAERIDLGLRTLGDGIGEQGGQLRASTSELSLRLQRTVDALETLEREARHAEGLPRLEPGRAAPRVRPAAADADAPPAATPPAPDGPRAWTARHAAGAETSRVGDASPKTSRRDGVGQGISSLIGHSEPPDYGTEAPDASPGEEGDGEPDDGAATLTYRQRFPKRDG